jgi:hypothetical protein
LVAIISNFIEEDGRIISESDLSFASLAVGYNSGEEGEK